MKLSYSTLGCPAWTLDDVIAKSAGFGFDGVELRCMGDKHVNTDMTADQRADIKSRFAAAGVAVASVAGYSKFCSDDPAELQKNIALAKATIDLAADLGAPYVRSFMGKYPEHITEDQMAALAAAPLTEVGEYAGQKGVKFLLETHDVFGTGEKLVKVLNGVKSEYVGVLWDVAHSVHEEAIEKTWELLGDKIWHTHLKDCKFVDGKEVLCHVGQGEVPLVEIVKLLKSKGYQGYYSLEWEKMWVPELDPPEVAFPIYVEFMRAQ